MKSREEIYEAITDERNRQDDQWGAEQWHNSFFWLSILGEEVGEAHEAALQDDIFAFRRELIQIAAVAVCILEAHEESPAITGGD